MRAKDVASALKRVTALAFVVALLLEACAKSQAPPGGNASPRPSPTSTSSMQPPSVSPSEESSPSPRPSQSPPPSPRPSTSPVPTPSQTGGLPASLIGTQWYRLPTSRKVVALSFDAGGDNAGVASILATLKSSGVRATFFLVGTWAEVYPSDARSIAARYPVGNHTYSHPDLTKASDRAIRTELARGERAILDVTGRNPKPLFRFPFGAWSHHAIDVVNSVGYGCIYWTVASRGWVGTSGGETVDKVVHEVLAGLAPGAIVVMHVGANPKDHSTLDADALPRVIEAIRARGYSFVTIDQYL